MKPSESRVELIPDQGARAASEDFFRSTHFFAAEGVTHSLLLDVQGRDFVAPLLVRRVPGRRYRDAISPYGYPGFSKPAGLKPLDHERIKWAASGLVSLFIRHSLGSPPPLTGATARNTVLLADPEIPRKSRMSDRQQIRKNLQVGFRVSITPGPETSPAERAAFLGAYTETMQRTQAAPRYFFDADYFDTILTSPATWLFLIREPGGEVAAGSIAARSDEMLHYYLSGTADAHLRGAPMKNILAAMTDFAWSMELPLNLGGGIRPGDPLEQFKRGFANREERLYTSEIVARPAVYKELCKGRDGEGFFPAYRAPSES